MVNLSLQILNFRRTLNFFFNNNRTTQSLKVPFAYSFFNYPLVGNHCLIKAKLHLWHVIQMKKNQYSTEFLYLAASTSRQARSKNTHREIASSLAESHHSQTLRHVLVQRILRLVTRVPFTLASILTEAGRGGREKSTALRYTNTTQAYLILRQRREG